MNKKTYRLIFSRLRGMLVAVSETATAAGNTVSGETGSARQAARQTVLRRSLSCLALRHAALGAMTLAGALVISTPEAHAQIVPGGAHAPSVIQTQSGIPQVNVNRPSAAGVSVNTYGQFDVQRPGAILNNSPTIVNTQQAGYINGNPNYLPGQSASIIVNQVNSNNPSQLRGYVEVAGRRAEVVIANSSGLILDGGGFINTSRAILTTGNPTYGGNGALTGFDVTAGRITVQGAGLNASNVDQVDLIARAVAANAAIYGNTLNVVAGANHVDHDTLAATPIAGSGSLPAVSIDVSQLGGMYANRIFLASNEYGVGVSNAGVLAAQAGDLTLQSNGQLVLAGKTTASGNLAATAASIQNSGSTYAQQSAAVNTSGALSNTGTLAAQQNTNISAASLSSSGTLGAGINGDGSIGHAGDLTVATSGALGATGHTAAGGNATLTGAALSLGGSQTSANGNLTLLASIGDMSLAGASVAAGGAINATARGTLTNDNGALSSAGAQTVAAGALSNQGGQIISQSTLNIGTGGALNNRQGIIQSSGNQTLGAASIDNTAGRVVMLGNGAQSVTATGALVNAPGITATGAAGGVIGSNGALGVSVGSIANQGQFNALGDASLHAQSIDNHAGSVTAGGNLSASSTGALNNRDGTLSGTATTVSGASVDNSSGTVEGNTLTLSSSGNLTNRGGHISQSGNAAQRIFAGGAFDNTGGSIASNATDLDVSAQSLTNDAGSIQHAGSGTLAVTTTGNLSNSAGKLVTNGTLDVTGAAVSNQGSLSAKGDATVRAQTLDNHAGSIVAGGALVASGIGVVDNRNGTLSGAATNVSGASVDNSNGTIEGDTLALSSSGNLSNRGGRLTQYGSADQTLSAGGTLDNTGGTLATNATNLTVSGQSITNDAGSIQHAGTGTLNVTTPGALSDVAGQIATNGALIARSASLDNSNGAVSAQGSAQVDANTSLTNRGGTLYGKAGLTATTQGAFDNTQGCVQTDGNLSVNAGGALSNTSGTISVNGASGNAATATVSASSIDNTSGKLTNSGSGATTITAATGITNSAGTMGGNGDVTLGAQTLTNTASAKFVAARVASLNVTNRVNNSGGTIYGGTALNLNQSGASVINDSGRLEGGQDVSVRVASLANSAGALRANRDITASGMVSGDGTMTAGRNLGLAVTGDYTNGASNSLRADGNMTVSATGALTNAGTLAASGALSASGANVVNAAGADINSASTTVNATGTLTNAGRIEGDSVTTRSATLANTGTLIGNTVQVNAADVQNTGAAAAIAAAQSLNIYASNSVTNSDGALIYSGGSLAIAKDGARDGSGMLANQTGTLTNSAATIEAVGDVDIAARTVNNLRTGVQTQAGTPQNTGTNTLTLWTAGLSGDDLGFYDSSVYPQWNWRGGAIGTATIGALMHPITVTVPKSQVASLDANAQTLSFTQPLTDTYISTSTPLVEVCNTHDFCSQQHVSQTRTITNNATQYYNGITDNGSTYTITLWPDYNPATNIRPDNVTVRTDLGSDNHDYVEMKRVSTSTTSTDQLLSAGTPALLQAQGSIRINSDGGAINNQSSTMTAGGNLIRRAVGGSVNDSGTVLQQTVTADTQSTYYWHQKTGGSDDTKIVEDGITQSTTTVAALPAIATANGAVQTSGQTISVASVNRVGQTVVGSGVTGGNATGTQLGGVNGQAADAGTAGGVTGQTASANIATGVSGLTVRPQTLGGAAGGIPNLKLPVNSLYTYQTAPGATYLVATDPRLTTYTKFISSDYLLGALGLNPQTTEKRLGDGAYEQQLVMNQVTQLTGRTFLAGYSDNLDEYTALMNSGVTYAKSFGLTPGIGLTDAQMKQLTTDLVWLVSQTVTLPDGTQQTVLVPKLYLAQANTVDLQDSGALVAGNAVSLNATGDVSNSGHIVGDMATAVLGNNIVNSGVIGSGGTTVVSAVQDVRNTSGRIGGVQTVVQAGRDVINETATASVSNTLQQAGFTSSASSQNILATGTISASENAVVLAQRDVNLAGAAIESGNSAFVGAGRNINVGTTTLGATQDAGTNDGLNGGHTTTTQNVGSTITTGGNLTTVSGGNTTLTNATVRTGGDAAMIAANNLTLTAATDTRSHNEQSLGGPQSKHTGSSYDETAQGSNLNAARDLTLGAGQTAAAAALLSEHGIVAAADAPIGAGNLTVLGSSATTGSSAADGSVSGGAATLAATGNVTIGAVTETHDSQSWSHNERSGFMSSDKTTDQTSSHQVISVGSTVSGDTVSANAGHDLTIAGSTVASTNDMSLSAGHDLTVTTTQDTSQSSRFHQEQKSGLGGTGGAGISYGTSDRKETTNDNSVTQNGSLVGSTDGSVTMTAGNGLHITGSDVIAARDVTGKAASVTIDAATGTNHHDETQETKTSGFTLGLGGSVGDAINNAIQQSQAAGSSQDGRAKALHTIAAVGNAGSAVGSLAGGGAPDISVQLSYGTSRTKNTFTEDQTTQTGSTVKAGGMASFTATGGGDGAASSNNGNVTVAGSSVSGNDVMLSAKNDVNLLNTTNTDSTRSTNESSSASVGVSYGTKGFGVSASMSKAHGDANSDAAMQNNTHVSAANNVSISSGGDTNIVGSNVKGNHVSADVGGNLNIASVQDTTVSSAHQQSSGGGFSISQGGGGATFSSQHGSANGNYAAVNGQAGIQAGSGGFDVNVKGNTDLKGAYIASDADPSKNTLATGTLTYSDMQNHSDYSASTSGFSAGTQGVMPMLGQSASGSSSATTKSGVSAGTITITDSANQKQEVASLNRDTSNLNGTVSKLPDVNTVLGNQADVMNAANAAGEAVAKDIGTYADYKQKAALDGAKAANALGETGTAAQYGQDAADWGEGGADRVGMHIVAGAVLGGLGGGNFGSALGGAAGAGVSAGLAPRLNELSNSIANGDPTGNATADRMLGQVVSNLVAGAAGAAVGGGAGAFAASNADRYNRQLHEDSKAKEQTLAKKLADESGGKYSEQDVENQMARMDLTVNGQTESGGVRVATGVQPQDGTDWQPYGVNKAGQQVWAQSLGPGDPDLQAYIAKGAQDSGLSYQPTTTGSNPGLIRAPDMVNFQVDYFVGSAWGTFTRDGNAFFGYGVNLGIPNSVGAGVNVSAGYLNTTSVRPGQTNNFAGGYAGGGSALYGGLGGGIMVSPGNGTATVIGFGAGTNVGKTDNPASVGWGFSNDQGKTGIKW
ncbi:two-partner secretion domain-containing protein [Paraburkholderia dioscoreae]|uniref:Filamentous hemagglutinin family N-terminal domain n=1 Tax=Paraburkholderia dioscoreae TaxID=2604047 RepID=A0A5Q4ZEW1_9BURK|nr:hemagglutinin repeat-containing protein [Paraburkholderia dioscoreae]VVD28098.1 Filamentous hemagglutinin family N-terminal domain [Paraburkholderia dioscoreae]